MALSTNDLVVAASQLVLAGLLFRRWVRARGTERSVPGWRLAAFVAGFGLLWVGVPALGSHHHGLLTAHMLGHLVLMTLVAPLLLLGAPVGRLGDGPAAPERPPGAPSLLERLAGHPVACWLAGTVTVLFWHAPSVLALTMHSSGVGFLQGMSFTVAGVLFWLPVIRPWSAHSPWPSWGVPVYLFLATLPCDALSAFLTFCGRPVYTAAFASVPTEQLLADQQRAGALMWVWVTLVYLVPAVWQVLRLLAPPGSRSSLTDPAG